MGDRAYYIVKIEAPEPLLGPIGRLLVDRWGFDEEWLPPTWTGPPPYQDTWTQEELNDDAWDQLATDLDLLMIDLDEPFAYLIRRDPTGSADGFWYGFIPGVGYASGTSDGDGLAYVAVTDLDRAIDHWRGGLPDLTTDNIRRAIGFQDTVDPAEELVKAVDALTARAWRQAWHGLSDLFELPDIPEPDDDHGTFVVTI